MKSTRSSVASSDAGVPPKRKASVERADIAWGRKSKEPVRQRELKKDAVLRTAAQAFLERGYHETTIDDIAARLSVSKPSVYAYVANKEQILVECARLAHERLDELFKSIPSQGGTALSRLRVFFRAYAAYALDEFGMVLVSLSDRAIVPENKRFIIEKKANVQKRIRKLVADGVADGSVAPCRVAHVSEILVSTFNGLYHWHRFSGELSLERTADELLNIVFYGIAAAGGREPAHGLGNDHGQ